MQHNSNISHQHIPESALDHLAQAEAILKEHYDDVVIAVNHQETRNIKVCCSTPYAGLGMLTTIQRNLKGSIENAEMTQMFYEESFEFDE